MLEYYVPTFFHLSHKPLSINPKLFIYFIMCNQVMLSYFERTVAMKRVAFFDLLPPSGSANESAFRCHVTGGCTDTQHGGTSKRKLQLFWRNLCRISRLAAHNQTFSGRLMVY